MFAIKLLALLMCHIFCNTIPYTLAVDEDICPFNDTVNLTSQNKLGNNSYLYQDILIPPEKTASYNYELRFLQAKHTVPPHIRGCVCGVKKPCTKLCCKNGEFLNNETGICEKIPKDRSMKFSWKLPIELLSGEMKVVNVFQHFTTQIGFPCENPKPIRDKVNNWTLIENGLLYIPSEEAELDTLNYCYSFVENATQFSLTPYSCPIENELTWDLILNTCSMSVSIFFLILTIIVYLLLKELRGNLRGKLLICYLFSLTISYSVLTFINSSGILLDYAWCNTLGYGSYFFFMAAFLWLSILCYDIWITFSDNNNEVTGKRKHNLRFLCYSLYVWLIAAAETSILAYLQLSPDIDDYYKPGLGIRTCWIDTSTWASFYYFYLPNLIIIIFNIITFIYITRKIYKVRCDLARVTQREQYKRENIIIILRLFLIMGISWLFDVLSYFFQNHIYLNYMFVISDLYNGIQGLLVFILFILRPKILNRLKYIFRFHKNSIVSPKKSVSTNTTSFSNKSSSTDKLASTAV